MAAGGACAFPLFRNKFFPGALSGSGLGEAIDAHSHMQRPPALKTLDLRALPKEDGPVSETQLRRQKYQYFEKQCSRVEEGLFLSGDAVARSRDTLQANGVTHVLNCVGFICKEYFKDQGLIYKTYYLHDTPGEDILTVLYDALEFIDDALKSGGRVLVHCSQGVSRSATLVIAYLMWKSGRSYDEIFAKVKEARGVANPNIGFTCQLLQWQKRRALQAPARVRMYRMTPHCPQAPFTLVAKSVSFPKQYPNNTYRELDRRGAFVVHTPTRIYTWIGSQCPAAFAAAARYHAKLLLKYEHAQLLHQRQGANDAPILEVMQGAEPPELLALLDPPLLDPEAARLNARRASMAEELATGSTSCNPADAEPMEVCSIAVSSAGTPSSSGAPSTSSGGAMAGATASPRGARFPTAFSVQPGQFRPQSGTTTPRHGGGSGSGWLPVGEVDEYTHDYRLYSEAVRLGSTGGGGGSTESVGAAGPASVESAVAGLRSMLRQATSVESPAAAAVTALLGVAHMDDRVPSRPDSPATAEGRMKKYRRSESELRISSVAHRLHPLPSLHTSLGDDEMDGGPQT